MIRKIIHIDRDKCNGCGACARACHEGAIDIIDGKAVLVREHFCDGLGDCLPACPADAITFEEREAPAYDEAAVQRAQKLAQKKPFSGCPGMRAKQFQRSTAPAAGAACPSQLSQWPVQIKLAGVMAPYFDDADLLIAADCTAYAYAKFHDEFLKDRVVLVGCPKLDSTDYAVKLAEIIRQNEVQSITVVRMEVPCCGGLEMAAKRALEASGKRLPWQVITVGTDGTIRE